MISSFLSSRKVILLSWKVNNPLPKRKGKVALFLYVMTNSSFEVAQSSVLSALRNVRLGNYEHDLFLLMFREVTRMPCKKGLPRQEG